MGVFAVFAFSAGCVLVVAITSATALLCAWQFACGHMSLTRYYVILGTAVAATQVMAFLTGGIFALAGGFSGLVLVLWLVGHTGTDSQSLGVAGAVRLLGWNFARAGLTVLAQFRAARIMAFGREQHAP